MGKGGRGSTRARSSSWERGSESFVLTDYLSEEDRPILPNGDCPRENKLIRGFTVFVILGQCQQWSLKKRHMTVRTKREDVSLLLRYKNLKISRLEHKVISHY